MRSREKAGARRVRGGDGQRLEGFLREVNIEMTCQVRGAGKLSDTEFRGDLPRGSDANQDGIGTLSDEFASGWRKRGIIGEPPQ